MKQEHQIGYHVRQQLLQMSMQCMIYLLSVKIQWLSLKWLNRTYIHPTIHIQCPNQTLASTATATITTTRTLQHNTSFPMLTSAASFHPQQSKAISTLQHPPAQYLTLSSALEHGLFSGGGGGGSNWTYMVLHIAQIASHEGCYCYLPCSDWTPPSTDCSSCTCQQTCRTCT
jgi:hypothetical protein